MLSVTLDERRGRGPFAFGRACVAEAAPTYRRVGQEKPHAHRRVQGARVGLPQSLLVPLRFRRGDCDAAIMVSHRLRRARCGDHLCAREIARSEFGERAWRDRGKFVCFLTKPARGAPWVRRPLHFALSRDWWLAQRAVFRSVLICTPYILASAWPDLRASSQWHLRACTRTSSLGRKGPSHRSRRTSYYDGNRATFADMATREPVESVATPPVQPRRRGRQEEIIRAVRVCRRYSPGERRDGCTIGGTSGSSGHEPPSRVILTGGNGERARFLGFENPAAYVEERRLNKEALICENSQIVT